MSGRSLVPDAQLGDIHTVIIDGRTWMITYQRLAYPQGMDAVAATSFLHALGLLDPRTAIRFRLPVWDLLLAEAPKIPRYGVTVHEGDTLNGDDLFSLLAAQIENGAIMEIRVTGPDADLVMQRLSWWFTQEQPGP